MTPVEILLVSPKGDPIANTVFQIQLLKNSFSDALEGVVLPRPVMAVTDGEGRVTVNLWPSDAMYLIEVTDTESDAAIFYKFIVPVVPAGSSVRLQDIVVNGTVSDTHYDVAALAAIADAKASSRASELAAAAHAAAAQAAADGVISVADDVVAAEAAATLAGQRSGAALLSAEAASTAKSAAEAALGSIASLSTTVGTQAGQVSADASAVAADRAAVASQLAGLASAVDSATDAAEDAQTAASTALAASVTTTDKAGTATAAAAAAEAAAADAIQAAIEAGNAAGNPVTSFNTRSGAVTLLSADVVDALGFTPYNATNPANYLTLAGLLGADGAGSGLDADLLDGQHGAYFLDLANATGTLASARLSGSYGINISGTAANATLAAQATILAANRTLTVGATGKTFNGSANVAWTLAEIGAQATLVSGTSLKTVNGSNLLGAGNVDTGGTVNGLLKANGAGVFSAAIAGTDFVLPSGSITGNAGTATKLATARTINGVLFDGTESITLPAPSNNNTHTKLAQLRAGVF